MIHKNMDITCWSAGRVTNLHIAPLRHEIAENILQYIQCMLIPNFVNKLHCFALSLLTCMLIANESPKRRDAKLTRRQP